MASVHPINRIIKSFNDYEVLDSSTIKFNGPFFGGPFLLRRVFGGHTFALAYYGLKILLGDLCLSKIQLNLFRPGDTEKPIILKLISSNSRDFFDLRIIQNDILIGTSKVRAVPSNNLRLKSFVKPIINEIPRNPNDYTVLKNMKLLATHPEIASYSDKRYNKEWLFELRPLDWTHFHGKNKEKKPDQTFAKLNKDDVQDDLNDFDPVVVLLLLADFYMFQDVVNVHKKFNRINDILGGSTMNFSANIFDISGVHPYTQFYIESELSTFNREISLIPGRIFDTKGQCLMNFTQENFRTSNNKK